MGLGSRNNQHSFAAVPAPSVPRSSFDRSFTVKDTMDFDYLNPIFVEEVLPGDTINLSLNTFVRLATQKVPILDNLWVDYYFFFVPNRIIWTNWKKFMGEQLNPGDSISYTVPQMTIPAGGPEVGSLSDKFGLPTDIAAGYTVNTLPYRAYNLIWNSWFKSQDLDNDVVVDYDDGPDTLSDYVLLKARKKHDYFTSALPSPQKGTAVSLPLGTTAPVTGIGLNSASSFTNSSLTVWETGSASAQTFAWRNAGAAPSEIFIEGTDADSAAIYADLTNATAATINELRLAMLTQSFLELMARGGSRYVEIILAHFGVQSPDFRLQRPEMLSAGTSRINIHPVAQTAITSGSNALGQLAAFGTGSTGGNIGFAKSFTEHGIILGLCSARADVTYQQGLNKLWSRSTRLDYYWPKLQQLGEQTILKKELYLQGTADDTTVFGYQERHAEYRFRPSEIHGKFRSQYATPIDQWHMAEEFGSLPSLNSTFLARNTPIDRAIAVTGEPHLLFDAYVKMIHVRPMMTYAIPATLGRF